MNRRFASVLLWASVLSLIGCSGGNTDEVTRVILVTLDTTRADRLGCYGYADAQTPELDAFARNAMLFEQAVSPIPTTLPSHSTMLTGLYPQDHGVRYNLMFKLGPEARTLQEVLREDGFATSAFPAAFVVGREYGLAQGFDLYKDPPAPAKGRPAHASKARPADEGVDDLLAWLAERPDGSKSFAWVHFYDPHHPYDPPFPYSSKFKDRPYDGEISFMDSQFGRLMRNLQASPDWDRTVVIVAGDHGEGLYDHGEKMHQNLVYESTQRVPFLVRAPGGTSGRVAEPVGLADIMPTVLDIVGIDFAEPMRGISLRPALEGRGIPRRDIYFESLAGSMSYGWQELRGVRYGRWKLIESPKPELFDLETDPGELQNLATLEEERLAELRGILDKLKDGIGQIKAESAHDNVLPSAETLALLNSLGYTSGSGGSAKGAPLGRELVHLESEMLRGQNASLFKDQTELEELTRHILEEDPTNKWALNNLVNALLNTGRAREAQDYAAELLRLYSDSEHSYATLARTYNAQGIHDEALRVIEGGLAFVDEDKKISLRNSELLSYLYLAASFDLEKEDVCSKDVPEMVARFRSSNNILIMQARCEALDGAVDAALATLTQAVDNGFRRVDVIEAASDFEAVVGTAEFSALSERAKSEADRPS